MPEENGPREPFESGIDDAFDLIEKERKIQIEEDALKLAGRTRLQTSKQVEDAVARQFPPGSSLQTDVVKLKEIAVLHTDLFLTYEPMTRRNTAGVRRAFREIDSLRLDSRGALGGAARAMKDLENVIKEERAAFKRELDKLRKDKGFPGLFLIIIGACAIVIAGMYIKLDDKIIIGLAGGFAAGMYEIARRIHDRKSAAEPKIETKSEEKKP